LGQQPTAPGFTAVVFHQNKLFTLEPLAHQVCRRAPATGAVERCWSFVATALSEARRYPSRFGTAEALWLDAEGAWVGVDNNDMRRADGEQRPIVWRFAAPAGGWNAP